MLKANPDLEVIAEPRANIERRKIEAFVVADMLADLVTPTAGTAGVYVAGNSGSSEWRGLGNGLTLQNVGFARFRPDGEVSYQPGPIEGEGGFYVLPYFQPLDSAVQNESVQGTVWVPKKGDWRMVSRATGTSGTGIYNVSDEDEFEIETAEDWPAGAGLTFGLAFNGQSRSGGPGDFRQRIGTDLSFRLRHGAIATLERESFNEDGDPEWNVVRSFDQLGPINLHGGRYNVRFHTIAGRLVWSINGRSLWLQDTGGPDERGELKGRDWYWAAAPLQTSIKNARVRLELGTMSTRNITGTIRRRIPRALHQDTRFAYSQPHGGGWQKGGSSITVEVEPGDDYVDYISTLTPSPDGIHSPFQQTVLLNWSPVWTTPVATPVDISRAVTAASINLAAPPDQAGTDGTVDLDRGSVEKLTGGLGVIEDYCPVRIRGRWRDSSGTPGPWHQLFKGYWYGYNRTTGGVGMKTQRVNIRDEIVRLTKPAAIVDHRFRPLGCLLLDKLAAAGADQNGGYDEQGHIIFGRGRNLNVSLWAGECVKEIIERQLGPGAASTMNGNGDPRRFMGPGEIPLWSSNDVIGSYLPLAEAFGQALESGNLSTEIPFAPPYLDDCLGWIKRFCRDGFADFFCGRVDRNADPVLIFGQYLEYLDNAILITIPDAIGIVHHEDSEGNTHDTFTLEDIDYLMDQVETETRPDKDFNRTYAVGSFPGWQQSVLSPAMRIGEGRLPPSDFNSDIYSWERTLDIKNNLGAIEGGVEAIAALTLLQIAGLKKQWPRIRFPGEGPLQVGDVIQPRMNNPRSDSGMGIGSRIFRSTNATHNWTMNENGRDWKTEVMLRPLSKVEEIRFRRNQALGGITDWFR
jgi:hypothetical protein